MNKLMKKMEPLGIHILAEYNDCDNSILNNTDKIEQYMNEAADIAGATVVQSVFHTFNPHGVSGVVVIAESHLTIHTWPEHGYAAVDIFTCGDTVQSQKALEHLKKKFNCEHFSSVQMKRGVVLKKDNIFCSKPSFEEGRIKQI